MKQSEAFGLLEGQLAYGESDPAELPADLDDLLHLRSLLIEIGQALRTLRQATDEKVGSMLGPGKKYEYGDSIVTWRHGYKWKPILDAAEPFVTSVVSQDPEAVHLLFPMSSIRKTGVEKAAHLIGVDPDALVSTVLEKVWDKAPRVQVKPKEL